MNYKTVFYTLGMALYAEAVCLLLPMICAFCYSEDVWWCFLVCSALAAALGFIFTFKKPERKNIYAKEGFVIVSFTWILMSIVGCIPFMLSGAIKRFVPALFEIVSGFTTTGASVFKTLNGVPKSVLFWRSFSHWIGGMGVLVLLVSILPLSGGSNMHLLKAESTGPSVSKLVPRVKSSSTILYGIYIFITVALSVTLLIFGLDLFEALTITFGTVGTGGFGVFDTSIGGYSDKVQWAVTVGMILCGIDFSVYYLILMGKIKVALKSEEVRVYLGVIAVAVIVITVNCLGQFTSLYESFKHASIQVSSIITTTGFSSVDFNFWPQLSKSVLLALMVIGACAGSTGGGAKVSRIIILFKTLIKEIKVAAHPKSTHKVMMNGRALEHETVRAVNVYMVSYIAIVIFSVLFVSMDNFDFTTTFSSVLATLNNIGPGLSVVGPTGNFGGFSDFSLLVLIFDMLAGRLEIFPMLILFSKYTWKK
ncbi:MAG: TrkH family potassium uptake protein [Ruminococcaceae bacterium]|nr:TrkH family potassium uptake protein [Oscillospiraceae bacterium]